MKTTIHKIALISCASLLLTFRPSAFADGFDILGTPSIPIATGSDVVVAGEGLHPSGSGVLSITLPAGVTIKQALLYWEGRTGDFGFPFLNDPGPTDTIMVDAVAVTGDRISGALTVPSVSGAVPFNLFPAANGYRKDITPLLGVGPGLIPMTVGAINNYAISGMDFGFANDGVALVVIVDDGSGASNVQICDGVDVVITQPELAQVGILLAVPKTFTFPSSPVARVANLVNIVADAQETPFIRPSALDITIGAAPPIVYVDPFIGSDGNRWDTLETPIVIPPGVTNITVEPRSVDLHNPLTGRVPSSLTWIGSILRIESDVFIHCLPDRDLGCNPPNIPDCDTNSVTVQGGCVPVTITCTRVDTTNGCFRTRILTYTATDLCTNTASCQQRITWKVDTTPPVITFSPPGFQTNFQCFADYQAAPPITASAMDNCDGTNVQFAAISSIGGLCPTIIDICWIAVDQCLNTNRVCVRITIHDTIPPIIVCPSNIVVGCDTNVAPPCAANLAGFIAMGGLASDNCDTNLDYFCQDSPLINGQIFRTHTVVDDCTNAASCVQIITIVQDRPPMFMCPKDVTVECTNDVPPGLANIIQFLAAGGWSSTTNLLAYTCVSSPLVGDHCNGIITRTYTITDLCSNTVSCQHRIIVRDTTPPNIHCGPDKEVQCGTDWAFDIPTATDNCDLHNVLIEVVSTVTNVANPRCPRIFSVTRTWKATDSCQNSSFCNQTVTVVDTEPPNITCEEDTEVLCGIDWAFDIPSAVDKCDLNNVLIQVVSTVTNVSLVHCPKLYSVTRTWRATDSCGNAAFCNQTVTIVDIEPPNITCEEDKEAQCGTVWAFDIPSAVDKCDSNNIVIQVMSTVTNVATPRCPRIFSVTRTWRATDTCGNASFCNQTVTVVDTEPPNITCGQDKEAQCGTAWVFDIPTAVDLCDLNNVLIEVVSTVTNIATPRCPGIMSVTRTWRATDTCGNSAFCNQTVSVVDTLPPEIICGSDKEADCGASWAFDIPTAEDLCDPNSVVIQVVSTVTNIASPRCPKLFSVTRTWRANDSCGNQSLCNQTVSIVDTTPPNITCADDQIVECGNPFAFTLPYAEDLCDGSNVVIAITSTVTNVASPRCPQLFTVRRTWSATDTCGNESLCSQTITVVDTTPPNITCADDQIVECGNPFAFTPPRAVDACDGTNVIIAITSTVTNVASPRCPQLFTVRRSWSATDTCGNQSFCSQTITVVDTTPPNITCADDQIVECGNPFAFTRPYADDVCDGTNVTITITSTTTNIANPRCPELFTVRRTWSAKDTCGNESLCSQTITIMDTTPPNITCADDRVVQCGVPWNFTPPFAVDGCDTTNVTITIVSTTTNAALCPGKIAATRTWRATDTCGNSATCSQTVLVVDTRPPDIICANDRVVECGAPWNFTPPSAVDICDGTNVTITIVSTVTNALCGKTFAATRTWSASDQCGNRALCSQTILIVDTIPPTISCANNRILECGTPFSFTPPSALDVCDGTNVTITIVSTVTNALCGGTFVATRTWKATDQCGNMSVCSQTIFLVDTLAPVLIGVPSDAHYVCLGDVPPPPNVTAFDFCDPNTRVIYQATTNGTCPSLITRCWTAIDGCSNSVQACQFILVQPTPVVLVSGLTDQVVSPGASVTFCVQVSSACPVKYQWCKDNVVIPGETNECLVLSNVQTNDSGEYCIKVTGPCNSLTNCARLRVEENPCFDITKTVDQLVAPPGGIVTYTYVATNCGGTLLTDITISDDNGTPDVPGDDFVVCTIPSLPVGTSATCTRTVTLPVRLCDDATGQQSGLLITEILPDGNIKATFIQDFGVNDNTYGVNSIGWGNKTHQFNNLVGSDHAVFEFRNGQGQVVLEFGLDYISAITPTAEFPAGYRSLGVSGGDGDMNVGDEASVLSWTTSLEQNLNKQPFLGNLAQYKVNSPALNDPNSPLWEYLMIYTVVVDKNAFGASGFGDVMITDQHNSPGKRSVEGPVPCPTCVTNIATGTATYAGLTLTAAATATVCNSTNPPPPTGDCPHSPGFWKKHQSAWPAAYSPSQTVGSVFNKAPADAASKTLHQALDGKAGSNNDVKNLLRQAVAALLNAASPNIAYPFSEADIIDGVNMALMNGSKQAMESLKDLLDEANNNDRNCGKPSSGGNCDTDGKPNALTFQYNGQSCAAAMNSQMAISGKTSCSGDPMGAPVVRIIASSSSSTPTAASQRFFDGMVNLGDSFDVRAADGGDDRFGSNTYLFIYNGATLVQTIQIHTSCSAPLIRGETFGSLVLADYRIEP